MATYDDAFLNQLFQTPMSQFGQMPVATDPLNRVWAYTHLIPEDVEAYKARYSWNPGAAPLGGWDGEGNWTGFSQTAIDGDKYARELLQIFDTYGVNSTDQLPAEVRGQLPNQGLYQGRGHGGSLGQQFVDYVTSPPVLLALGAGAGMYAGAGSAAGSAGAEGAVTGASGELAAGGAAAYGGSSVAGSGGAASTAATGGELTAEQWAAGLNQNQLAGYEALPNTAANQAARQTALSRVLDGTASTQDYVTLFGQVAPSLLGMYASDRQADAYGDLAARYEGYGAPYRDRLAATYSDPTAFLKSPEVQVPVQMGTDALARALSTQGNPAGSGTALQTLQDYATNQYWSRLGQERDRLAGFGGLTQYAAAAPQIQMGAIGAEGNVYNALGAGVANVTQPPRTLEDMIRLYEAQQRKEGLA